jgi:dihydrodipicolinate synthase/N-acetylneuraminate lyase
MNSTDAISTCEVVRLTRHAELTGAGNVRVVPVTYCKPNEDELEAQTSVRDQLMALETLPLPRHFLHGAG